MPTATGGDTIGERLKKHRVELARIQQTIARSETNGSANMLGGVQVTEISYERALARQSVLEGKIAVLEARVTGSAARPGLAQLATKLED